jgi:hypothetical protein
MIIFLTKISYMLSDHFIITGKTWESVYLELHAGDTNLFTQKKQVKPTKKCSFTIITMRTGE